MTAVPGDAHAVLLPICPSLTVEPCAVFVVRASP